MDFVDRMVKAGLPLRCADKIAASYIAQGDVDGLEAYVIALEARSEIFTVQSEPAAP